MLAQQDVSLEVHAGRTTALVGRNGAGKTTILSGIAGLLKTRSGSIELLGKREDERWRRSWERVLTVSSTVAPFCWGLIWSAALHGIAGD